MNRLSPFDLSYALRLEDVLRQRPSYNARTGRRVKAVHGMFMKVDVSKELPMLALRDINPLWALVEIVWFMSGSADPEFMRRFGFKTWDKFADHNGLVSSATGYRWRETFGVDQLVELVNNLEHDRTTRQGVLISWNPLQDLVAPGPNVPCIPLLHFGLEDDTLHMSVFQRSADMYFGFPHDILGFAVLQALLASRIDAYPGDLNYTIANAHLYEDQWKAAEEMISRAADSTETDKTIHYSVPKSWFSRALVGDQALPDEMYQLFTLDYRPWPAIKGPKLVL